MKCSIQPNISGSEALERSRQNALIGFISILCAGLSGLNTAVFALEKQFGVMLYFGVYFLLYLSLRLFCRQGMTRYSAHLLSLLYISNSALSTLFFFSSGFGYHFYLLIVPGVVWILFPCRAAGGKTFYSLLAMGLFFFCEFSGGFGNSRIISEYSRIYYIINILFMMAGFMICIRYYARYIQEDSSHLSNLASTDSLTGLRNRRFLDETGEMDFREMRIDGKELSVLMLDLDHFKAVNDSFGHDAGDKVLEALGALLKKSFRSADKVCRYGGEEFLVVLKGTGPRDSLRIAEELRQKIAVMEFPDYRELNISASLGVAHLTEEDTGLKDVILRADKALYYAKAGGRNCVKDDQNNSIALLKM